jgi:hypothetical protein
VIFVIKLTLLQNYTCFTTSDIHFIKTHINIIIFDTFDRTVSLRNLRIYQQEYTWIRDLVVRNEVN